MTAEQREGAAVPRSQATGDSKAENKSYNGSLSKIFTTDDSRAEEKSSYTRSEATEDSTSENKATMSL